MPFKAFRLFVSSTFADFTAERDILQRRVFPTLDAYCIAKGYQFHPLDLRWGINDEAQLDQRTTEICLNEVRAAKKDYPPPNFLIMIGSRYGFVPLPYAIALDEFEAIAAWLSDRDRQDAVRALGSVYQRDDNYMVPRGLADHSDSASGNASLIPAYTLRSRASELPELRSAEAWAEREAELRAILQETADGLLTLGKIEATAHEKYFLSLTDQEIIHGLPGYRPAANGVSSTVADGPPAIAFIREIVNESGAPAAAIRHYFEQQPRLDALRDGIKRALPEDHVVASALIDQNAKFSATYLADFAAQIQAKLQTAIDRHIARIEALEHAPDYALASERAAHHAFGRQKLQIFVGRERQLDVIARYIASAMDYPLVLRGRSGLGKSALMARAIADAESAGERPVVARFIGGTAASSNVRALLISVIEDLAAHGVVGKPAEFEQDANKFNAQIEKLMASIGGPIVVFLDALDQLQEPDDLGWLPVRLPATLKLVISVLDDPAYEADSSPCRDLQKRLAPDAFVEIEPLGRAQGHEIVSAMQQQSRHRLQDGQRDYIIRKFEQAGASPLYLKAAFEIARSWKSHHTAGTDRFVLAGDTEGVIAQLIDELSSVHHHEPELVARTLGYLAAAKNGLSAKELTDILSQDQDVMRAISSERHGALTVKLPPSVWVRLNRDLSPFLVEKQIDDQPLLQFFHRQVAHVARRQHDAAAKHELHASLAAYFETQVSGTGDRPIYAKRGLSELPYQLHHAEHTSRLGEILMSPNWMQQKLAAFGPHPLIEDYRYARDKAQRLTGQALELATGPLARDVGQLAAQIFGRVTTDLVGERADIAEIDGLLRDMHARITPPVFMPRWPSLMAPGGPEIRRFEGHFLGVTGAAFSPDGQRIISVSASGIEPLRIWEVANGREIARFGGRTASVTAVAFARDSLHVALGFKDGTLQLWNVASRQSRHFEGSHAEVVAVALSSDGRHIVSSSADWTPVRLWEVASGREIACLGDRSPVADAVAFSPDGRHVAAGYRDGTLRLWELASGQSRCFEGHTGALTALAYSPDGRHIVACSWDMQIWLWEVASGRPRRFEGDIRWIGGVALSAQSHTRPVRAVAFSPDGRQIVSGSEDQTLRVWDVTSSQSRCFEGHTGFVTSVAFSPDGRNIISGSLDTTLRLWEVAGHQSRRFDRHGKYVTAVAVSPDGRQIISGAFDYSLLLWDVASGQSRRLEGARGTINAVAFSPDGQCVASAGVEDALRLWDVVDGPSRQLKGHTSVVNSVAFSPDGRHMVSGSSDKTLRLWDVASGQSRCLEGHTDSVRAVAFSPDGRHIVSGSLDKTVRLWDLASGQSRCFDGPTLSVKAVAFSPDGRQFVSGADDGTLLLGEIASGKSLRLEGHEFAVE
jgi:WD40 repeat protein